MATKETLKAEIQGRALSFGSFILSSGETSNYYIDLRSITLGGTTAPLVGELMLEITKDLDYEAVGGLTLGADPVALSMLHVARNKGMILDSFIVRKETKSHGRQRQVEGPDVSGRKVLVVEDTSTTGNSIMSAISALTDAGATIVGVAVVVDRGAGEIIRSETNLSFVSVFNFTELVDK